MAEHAEGLINKMRNKLGDFWQRLTDWPAGISVAYSAIYILLVYRNNVFDVPPGEVAAPLVFAAVYVYAAYYALRALL